VFCLLWETLRSHLAIRRQKNWVGTQTTYNPAEPIIPGKRRRGTEPSFPRIPRQVLPGLPVVIPGFHFTPETNRDMSFTYSSQNMQSLAHRTK
jgi:hypothetical protein